MWSTNSSTPRERAVAPAMGGSPEICWYNYPRPGQYVRCVVSRRIQAQKLWWVVGRVTHASPRNMTINQVLSLKSGGGYRNRTDLHGFAIQRIACLPTRRPDAPCRQGRGERQADKRRLRPDKTRDTTRQRRACRRAHRWPDSPPSGGSEGLHPPMSRAHRLVASAGNCGSPFGPWPPQWPR